MLRGDPAHRRSHVKVLEVGPAADSSLTSNLQHLGENQVGGMEVVDFVVHASILIVTS